MNAPEPRYRVFLSYSHADSPWARWLMRRLEAYRIANRFQGRTAPIGVVGGRIAPVFRDRDELPTTSDLGATIRTALAESATLVVVCSPAAAKSRWVQEEILMFKRLHGDRRVFAFIVGGEPRVDAPDDCFPPALRVGTAPDGTVSGSAPELAAADARPQGDGRETAFVRLVAGLLGVGFDELRRRELQRRHRRLTIIATSSVIGMALTLGLALFAWQARNDALRRQELAEDLLGFMVGDLREPLAKLNKLEILDTVGAKALAYFASLDPRDLTDVALRRQAEALRQIGENRRDQGRNEESLQALQASYTSAKLLTARHPQNGEMLFERAQAEYWIGLVLRRLGRVKEMTEWLVRYRDSTAALVALKPDEPRWQTELAAGHHNLAVVDVDEERLESARRGFLGELDMLEKLAAADPKQTSLQIRLADTHSWLGTVAEMNGDFSEAARRFAQQVAGTEAILRREPDNAAAKRRLADALSLQSSILAITGDRATAMAQRRRARTLLESLVAGDPKNYTTLRLLLWARLKEAELLYANGELAAATALGDELRERFEKLLAAEPRDQRMEERLVFSYRLQAELLAAQQRDGADQAAARAVETAERLVAARQSFTYVSACAQAHLTAGRIAAGRIAARRNQSDTARTHAQRALDLLKPRLAGSNHWRILFPAAAAYELLDQPEAGRRLVVQLQRLGFQPLEPWPGPAPLSRSQQPPPP